MWPQQKFLLHVIFLLILGQYSIASKYNFILENEGIFSACENPPKNALGIDSVFDLSEITFKKSADQQKISVSGNISTLWNIEATDRIQVDFNVWTFKRNQWQSTILGLSFHDFCKILFDKNQYIYKFWSQYIINKEDLKGKCIKVPGIKIIHKPFDLEMLYDVPGLPMSGRYKIVGTFMAFDKSKKEKGTSACFEIIGEMVKIK